MTADRILRFASGPVGPRKRLSAGSTLLAAIALVALAGCGGGGGGGDTDAVELTKWLPRDASGYTAVDLAAYKDAQGLPEDADPISTNGLGTVGAAPFTVFFPPVRSKTETVQVGDDSPGTAFHPPPMKALIAVDSASVTAAATSQMSRQDGGASVAVLATDEDTGEIGSRLGDIGYRDDGGVLVAPGNGPSILLGDGLVYASDDTDALRAIPDEPADDLPAALLGRLEGIDLFVNAYKTDCVREAGVSVDGDGTGQIGFLIDGDADADRIEPAGAITDPRSDGDIALAGVESEHSPVPSARSIQGYLFPTYDCG